MNRFFLAALDLRDRDCVLFGSGAEARQRAGTLVEHGARLLVVAPQPDDELRSWCTQHSRVRLEEREPLASDLDGVWLAVLAERHEPWRRFLAPLAERSRIFFCAVDDPAENSFAHVGVARAGALQIGVSTSGALPGIAGGIRRELQKQLDESQFERIVDELAERRELTAPAERGALVRSWAKRLRWEGRLHFDDE